MENFISNTLISLGITSEAAVVNELISLAIAVVVIYFGGLLIKSLTSRLAKAFNPGSILNLFFSLLGKFVMRWAFLIILFFIFSKLVPFSKLFYYAQILTVLLITLSIAKFVSIFLTQSMTIGLSSSSAEGKKTLSFLTVFTRAIVYIIALLIFFDYIGVQLTPLLATLGIGGLAFAFALQDTLSNLVAGIQVALLKQFQIGSYVSLGGIEGVIDSITWRHTVIKTASNEFAIIPNKTFSSATVSSISQPGLSVGYAIPFTSAAGSDLAKVESAALQAASDSISGLKGADKSFTPKVSVTKVSAAGNEFVAVVGLTENTLRGTVQDKFYRNLYNNFNKNNLKL